MAKQPKIRFKGFTEEWKEGKIGDAFCERDEHSGNGELLSVTINSGIRRAKDMERTFATGDLSKYKVVQKGDIAYNTMRMWQGACGVSDYSGIVSPAYTIATPKDEQDSAFYAYYFKSNKMLHDFRINSQGLTSDTWNLRYPVFAGIDIHYPSKKEQQEISLFLRSLDTTISQRETELEKLKNIKRALLEKLFPQDGQSIPAIRFKGFNEKWEPKSLGEVADKVTTKNISCSINETFTNSAEYGIMSQRDFFDHSISNSNNISGYYVVQQDDFVYNPRISKNAPVGPINRNKLGRSGVVSPLYTVFRPNGQLDLDYLEVFFWQYSWNKFMKFNGNSGARLDRFSISDEVFWQMPIQSPKTPEQKKVANTLLLLSKTISLRERQLTLLKHSKQALLEQMFVNN